MRKLVVYLFFSVLFISCNTKRTWPDGTWDEIDVVYCNPNTSYSARYKVEIEIKNNKVIKIHFPNGESLKDVEKRIRSFLKDLLEYYHEKNVAIVSHRSPQLALEVILNKKSWKQAIKEDWRLKEPKEWRPGWEYKLEEKALK